MEIKGKVYEIGQILQVTEKLQKRELILEVAENPQYPEYIKFETINDKCALLDNVRVGDEADVSFNLRGRPWTDKTGKKSYFNSLHLWKIKVTAGGVTQVDYARPADLSSAPDEDDLPF